MRKDSNKIIYSPSDLIRYLASPFASWLDRYYLENLGSIKPDGRGRSAYCELRRRLNRRNEIVKPLLQANHMEITTSKAIFH